MADKEDLLNNLKINPEDKSDDEPLPSGKIAVAIGLVCLLGLFGWWFLSEEETQKVTTFTVKSINASGSSATSILDASGYVTARRKATVSSKSTGKVLEVFVEEGMYVEEGQLLAQLDDSTQVADLQYAESQLKQAKLVYKSTSALVEGNFASPDQVKTAEAKMEGAQALVNLSKQRLTDMKIMAPFGGVVVQKNAQPGEMISPIAAGGGFTATGICTIVDMESLEIEVDVNEAFINRVVPNQPVLANLNAYPKWDVHAEVIAIIPTADKNKATVRVRIRLLEKDERVLPDMGVRVSFLQRIAESIGPKKEGVIVPNAAVHTEGEVSYVLLVINERIEIQEIEVAEETSNYSRVVKGIRAGDQVVASYNKQLENNQKVSVN
tara:strand:+ start:856 stop:1998 length:1143 start_codon:yes stop_codon:yes gene_type:complete